MTTLHNTVHEGEVYFMFITSGWAYVVEPTKPNTTLHVTFDSTSTVALCTLNIKIKFLKLQLIEIVCTLKKVWKVFISFNAVFLLFLIFSWHKAEINSDLLHGNTFHMVVCSLTRGNSSYLSTVSHCCDSAHLSHCLHYHVTLKGSWNFQNFTY